jgi:nonribosomal peptide synthetase DhbF
LDASHLAVGERHGVRRRPSSKMAAGLIPPSVVEGLRKRNMAAENVLRELMAGQLGIWNAQQLEPDSTAFNVSEYLDIRGPLDVDLFRTALRRALDATDAYRLRFTDTGGTPQQYVDPARDHPIRLVDVSGDIDPPAAAEALMRADRARRIDLDGAEPYVQIVFVLGPERHLWYQRLHHLVADGYSLSVFAGAVAEIYEALVEGGRADCRLEPLAVLLDAESDYRRSADFATDRRFWLDTLANPPEPGRSAARRRWLPDTLARQAVELPVADAVGLRAKSLLYVSSSVVDPSASPGTYGLSSQFW